MPDPIYRGEHIQGIVVCQQKSTIWSEYGSLHRLPCYYDDPAKAAKIAQILVERKLAACVNIIPEIQSILHGKGRFATKRRDS